MKNKELIERKLGFDWSKLVVQESTCSNPELSVVVITYNHASFIESCLKSILCAVEGADYELVIADDKSNDGTWELIHSLTSEIESKVTLIRGSREDNILINGRPTGIYNWHSAVTLAKGRYVSVIEGDDYYVGTDAMQVRLDVLRTGKYSAVWGRAVSDESSEEEFESEEINQQALMFWSGKVNTCGLMYRNDDLDARDLVPFTKCMNQDLILYHALLSGGRQGLLMSEVTSFYRLHQDSTWSSAAIEMKRIELIKTAFMLAGHHAWDDNLPEQEYDRKWLRWIMSQSESSWKSDVAQIKNGVRGLLLRIKSKFK